MSKLDPKIPSSEMDDVMDNDGGGGGRGRGRGGGGGNAGRGSSRGGYADESRIEDETVAEGADFTMPAEANRHLMELESSFRVDEDLDQLNGARRYSQSEEDEDGDEHTGNILDSSPDRGGHAADSTGDSLFPQPKGGEDLKRSSSSRDLNKKPSFGGGGGADRSSSPFQERSDNINLFSSDDSPDQDNYPLSPSPNPLSKRRPPLTNQPSENGTSSKLLSGGSLTVRKKGKFLRSRHSSQHDSISSVDSMGDEEDAETVTGGGRNVRKSLSRTTSLGSIASGITPLTNRDRERDRTVSGSSAAEKALARLDEEERSSRMGNYHDDADVDGDDADRKSDMGSDGDDILRTPTRTSSPQKLPTDTAIAKRVGNIEVPPTVARDLRSKFLPNVSTPVPTSPSKRLLQTPHPAAGGAKNMTLKEQSSIIDKLQKENFDLKIKVYYLNDKLERLSDEGVAETMKENIEMKVKLAEVRREWKSLKKENRELHIKLKGGEDQVREEIENEVIELREIVERYEIEIETMRETERRREEEIRIMREKDAKREADIRRMNEHVRGVGSASSAGGRVMQDQEIELLQELLEQETARREHAEAETRMLRDDLWRAQSGRMTAQSSKYSDHYDEQRSTSAGPSSTNRMKIEIEDLRQKVAAQTSMLTSRNRERERLYQEMEELKMHLRSGGGELAYDNRSMSRLSGMTTAVGHSSRGSAMADAEREEYENAVNSLRDKVSELKLLLQEAENELESYRQQFSESEHIRAEVEEELELRMREQQSLEADRIEALRHAEDIEIRFGELKDEAEEEIKKLEDMIDDKMAEIDQMNEEAREREEGFEALQAELRQVTEIVVRLEDQQQEHQSTVEQLQEEIRQRDHTIEENEHELNALEQNLVEANSKIERSNVQMESLKGEIRFLREEQDSDKMRIGELEGELKKVEGLLQDERENKKAIEMRLEEERKLREERSNMVEQELNNRLTAAETELLDAKNEVRQLRKSNQKRGEDAKLWRGRLEELERALREALGDSTGNRADLLNSVVHIQKELQKVQQDLEFTRSELSEKERLLKDRDNLLERTALESRRLTELLDKERQARKNDRNQLESLQGTHQNTRSSLSQQQKHVLDLEKARSKAARDIQALEERFKAELAERNNLLLALWIRLTKLCGPEWTTRNSLANAPSVPGTPNAKYSMESAVINAFPGFQKNLLTALKAIENVVQSFKTRVRNVERDLWKEYQVVETALESRTRRLERLEALVRGGVMTGNSANNEKEKTEQAKLKAENRLLKAEIAVLKRSTDSPTGSKPSLERSQTDVVLGSSSTNSGTQGAMVLPGDSSQEKRWILRLRELEKRLKLEREARLMDRDGAKKRLEEERGQKEELRKELERAKEKGQAGASS